MGTLRSVVPSLQLCSCYKYSTTKVWKEHPLYSSFDVHWKWARWEVLSRRYSFALVTNIAPQRFGKNIPYIPPLMSTENGHVEKCCPVATALLLLQTWHHKGLERTSLIFLLWCPLKMGTLRSVVPSLQLCSCYKHSTTKVWKEHPLYSSFDVHWKWARWEVLSRRYSFALVTNIAPQRFGKTIPYIIPPLTSTENGHIEKCCPVATALLLLQT